VVQALELESGWALWVVALELEAELGSSPSVVARQLEWEAVSALLWAVLVLDLEWV
jgi:hypothetical protein